MHLVKSNADLPDSSHSESEEWNEEEQMEIDKIK